MWPDVSRCVPMFRDFSWFSAKDWVLDEAGGFLKSTTQNCRFGIFWEAKTILGLLQCVLSLLRINTVNRTKFCHLFSPRSWEARSKSYYIFETTTELYTQNILSRSGGTWCNIESLSYMQSYKQCPVCFERKNSVSSRGSRAPGFALHWNIQV